MSEESDGMAAHLSSPLLHRRIAIPEALLTTGKTPDGSTLTYGGDIRIGDLDGDGNPELIVYRSVNDVHDGGGMKPCFMGAFTMDGRLLWKDGEGGLQPSRPGPVAVYDVDGDGRDEIICFFLRKDVVAPPDSLANVAVQIREGATGRVLHQSAPHEICSCRDSGANWVHQRILVANLRGGRRPRDFVVKLGQRLVAFDDRLRVLWTHTNPWREHGLCPAYTPAVGDIDSDGCDEVNGGYFLLDQDGAPLWEGQIGLNMDSVSIAPWDSGRVRALCSGFGQVLDEKGSVLLRLGEQAVPHGQELRVGRFRAGDPSPQMAIRWNGHNPDVLVADTSGDILARLALNPSPNNTGMETVRWNGEDGPDLLYNGGMLWDPLRASSVSLPCLAEKPAGGGRQGWYHCIPADVCGDSREEAVIYNPWEAAVYIFTPEPLDESAWRGYSPGPRQYNPRLMD